MKNIVAKHVVVLALQRQRFRVGKPDGMKRLDILQGLGVETGRMLAVFLNICGRTKPSLQTTDTVLMVSPAAFGFNEQTAGNNACCRA